MGPLSDEEVIRKVSSNFVPVALDHRNLQKGDDDAGRLVRMTKADPAGCIGLWIVSPEGKILARPPERQERKEWTREVLSSIDLAVQASGSLAPRQAKPADPYPFRAKGVRPDGGVSLGLSARLMHKGRADGPMVIDTLTVPPGEWASLAPPRAEAGAEWTLPETFVRRCSVALVPVMDEEWIPRAEEVRTARITAVVEAVHAGRALIRLEGRWEAERPGGGPTRPFRAWATAEGTAEVDLASRSLRSLLVVFKGQFDEFAPAGAPRETGAVLEWTR